MLPKEKKIELMNIKFMNRGSSSVHDVHYEPCERAIIIPRHTPREIQCRHGEALPQHPGRHHVMDAAVVMVAAAAAAAAAKRRWRQKHHRLLAHRGRDDGSRAPFQRHRPG